MMCLGWKSNQSCKTASDPIAIPGTAVAPGQMAGSAGNAGIDGAGSCDISWFWVSLLGVVGLGLVKR